MLATLLLSVLTAANISAVASVPADVSDRDASFASDVLLTLLLAMLLLVGVLYFRALFSTRAVVGVPSC
jgi:hypothetical protein